MDTKELRRLLSEMTQGTWIDAGPVGRAIWLTRDTDDIGAPDDHQIAMFYGPTTNPRGQANATGVVAMRNAAPALLDAVDELAALRLEHEAVKADHVLLVRALLTTVKTLRDPRLAVSEGVVDGVVAGIKEATGMDLDAALATLPPEPAR